MQRGGCLRTESRPLFAHRGSASPSSRSGANFPSRRSPPPEPARAAARAPSRCARRARHVARRARRVAARSEPAALAAACGGGAASGRSRGPCSLIVEAPRLHLEAGQTSRRGDLHHRSQREPLLERLPDALGELALSLGGHVASRLDLNQPLWRLHATGGLPQDGVAAPVRSSWKRLAFISKRGKLPVAAISTTGASESRCSSAFPMRSASSPCRSAGTSRRGSI